MSPRCFLYYQHCIFNLLKILHYRHIYIMLTDNEYNSEAPNFNTNDKQTSKDQRLGDFGDTGTL